MVRILKYGRKRRFPRADYEAKYRQTRKIKPYIYIELTRRKSCGI
jgi:hypothetical protein